MRKRVILFSFVFIAIFACFWVRGAIYLDPDFGYRLKTGELILSSSFPEKDPYSYTMPSFPYVEHAWLVASFWAYFLPIIGNVGLALVAAILALGALLISVSRVESNLLLKKLSTGGSFLFLLATATILPFSGVRAQVFSWFITSILMFILFDSRAKKYFAILPFLFLLWGNLHGSFIAGLAILLLVVVVRWVRKKKIIPKEFLISVFSFAATLVNPYGVGGWGEALSSVTDTTLRWQISEWMPAVFMVDLAFISFLVFSTVMIYRFRKRFKIEEVMLYALVLLAALLSRRHIPLWVIVSLPLATSALNHFYNEVKSIKNAIPRFKKVYTYTWVGSLILLLSQSFFSIRSASFLREDRFYPKNAITFLKSELPSSEIFSEYGWGGYLVWKLPEKKVFIDGRMPSWKLREPSSHELTSAFDTYTKLLEGEVDYKKVFNDFGIDTVLWPKNERLGVAERLAIKIENYFVKNKVEKFDLITQLGKDGWEKIYEDETAFIYKRDKK